jgi:hypothetical protein
MPSDESRHAVQDDMADMVFDALGIDVGDVGGHAKVLQESHDELVALSGGFAHTETLGTQTDALIDVTGDEAVAQEPVQSAEHGHVGHAEASGQIRRAHGAATSAQIQDQLGIVFGCFPGMVLADPFETPGCSGSLGYAVATFHYDRSFPAGRLNRP